MSMFCQPIKVCKYSCHCIVLVLLLLMGVKGNTQWALGGNRTIILGQSYTYYPTYNGSVDYPYCGQYSWTIVGGYFTHTGTTAFQAMSECPVVDLWDLSIDVTWTSTSGAVYCSTWGNMSLSVAEMNPGSISPTVQYINFNTAPGPMIGTDATCINGSGCISYQWQTVDVYGNYTDIPVTTRDWYPSASDVLTTSTTFVRKAIDHCDWTETYSNGVTVGVYAPLTCSISPPFQNVSPGNTAATLTASVGGGSGSYFYQWQSSPDQNAWSNVSTASFYSPGVVNTTTYYRLIISSANSSIISNVATINACPVGSGTITGPNICVAGSSIKLVSLPAGGQWSTTNQAVAKVNANGVVTGVAPGTASIGYTVTNSNGCGTTISQLGLSVVPFSSYVQGLGRGIDDPLSIDTISLAPGTVKAIEFKQDTGRSSAHSIKNVLALRVIEETDKYIPGDFTATAVLKVEYGHSPAQIYQIDSIKLSVNYTANADNKYNALNYFTFNNAEYTRITVIRTEAPTTVNGTSFDTKQVLMLTNTLAGSRYYQLGDNKKPVLSHTRPAANPIADAVPVSWTLPAYTYNNAVQLEWTWLDDQMQDSYMSNNVINTDLLFKNGATRIDLPGSAGAGAYNIPLLYDGTGKLYMRVRAINMMPGGSRSDGPWSTVDTFAFHGHNDSLNWQATTTYSEDGKRKTVIQYFDGTLRSRQMVTKDNTTGQTVVAETLYDLEGRPAVQILPAPGINNIITYNKNLNKFNGQNDNTNPADYFDYTTTSSGNYATTPLNDSFGTAKYYSARNPDAANGYHKNIPAANGYAYTVTRYMNDATGRTMRQSGIGDSLSMGSGHETRYYYGTPAQEELDALFGTEVGNYTHYFKNMVRDANGQMNISYVDMHARTIATALAGDATPNMQALPISDTNQYKFQSGTTLTRDLLTKESNTLKGNSIESINTILAPLANTNYEFTYTLNKQTLTLPTCSGGTVSYDCKFDLQIAITDESGDNNPIVYTYTGIDNINFNQTIPLSAGSYSVRKTLTINQDFLAQFMAQYNTNGAGLCQTKESLIENIVAADSTASGCAITSPELTCSSCLGSLGNYNTYLSNYATSLGKTVGQLTPEQVNDIKNQYRSDSAFCISLNPNRSHTLETIREQMLSDMVPYSGQYATESGSGSMYNRYNIFSTADPTKYPQPYFKTPRNEAGVADNYYTSFGNIDASVSASRLGAMTKETFESEFADSWTASLLRYHPEFARLQYAENSLRNSFDFIDSLQLLTTPIEPVNSDPFFAIPAQASNKLIITNYATPNGYGIWKLAYGDAVGCKAYGSPYERDACYASMPGQLTAIGTPVDIIYNEMSINTVEITADIQAMAWNKYKALYGQVRGNMVNQYINTQANVTDPLDNQALYTQGFRIYFPVNDVQAAQSSGWGSWFPNDQGTVPTVNLNDSMALYGSHCESYINAWRQALLNCPALAAKDAATRESILNTITGRMLQVCKHGTDGANPYGASTVAPAYKNAADTSFEQIVNTVLSNNGISISEYCNPYGIQWPGPYGKNPPVTKQVIGLLDTCTCKQWAKIKTAMSEAGYNPYLFNSANEYLYSKYHETLTLELYNAMDHCGVPFLYNCPPDNGCVMCRTAAPLSTPPPPKQTCDTLWVWPLYGPQPKPEFLNCGFDSSNYHCYSCSEFMSLEASFYAIFSKHPVLNGVVPDDIIVWNNLFAQYVNFKTGLQHNWQYYAAQFNATQCGIGGISGTGAGLSICLQHTPLNDTTGLGLQISPCQAVRDRATLKATAEYEYQQQQALATFKAAYQAKCIAATESFNVKYAFKEYHYTLYYYDQAGDLIKTVPPKGVRPNYDAGFLSDVKTDRQKMENGLAYTERRPQHSLITRYCFNSLNKLVLQKSPDGGRSSLWYDILGRQVLSQNARQRGQGNVYSYTKYDSLNRITEVGQISSGSAITDGIAKNESSLKGWYAAADKTRNQVTQTLYDMGYPGFTGPLQPVVQQNLRNRVSYLQLWNNVTDNYPASGTYYSYDVHGNVDTLVQDFGNSAGIENPMNLNQSGNRFKKVVYDYDLITSKVKQISYQPGQADAYYHRYSYDAENRLTDMFSGRDSVILLLFPEREAHYDYYRHGVLARTALGQLLVQKQDYVYTLQGWLKGVNPAMGGTLANGTDTTEASPVSQDAYAYSLHYFRNDYKAIGYTPQATSVLSALGNNAAPLFNGNIAAIAVNIPKLGASNVYNYHYDQLNRLVAMDAYHGLNAPAGTFTPLNINDYRERASYDANGNILTYSRYGDAARAPMDSLKYFYTANTNQLHKVVDDAADASAANYSKYNDLRQGQADDNYRYDATGNLIQDNAEGLSNVAWNAYGKITSITKSSGVIRYVYGPGGQRIMAQTPIDTTVYVHDAGGNILSVYRKPAAGNLSQTEMHLFGSNRLGMATQHLALNDTTVLSGGFLTGIKSIFTRGEKLFEQTNHLSNVLVTVSDRRIQHSNGTIVDYYTPEVITANDYYPFGMLMPGRRYTANDNYRFGFNGKENDDNVKGEGNQQDYGMRVYDPRVARFLSVDPLTIKYPWYTPYQFAGNNPVKFIDLDGLEPANNPKTPGLNEIKAMEVVDFIHDEASDNDDEDNYWSRSHWFTQDKQIKGTLSCGKGTYVSDTKGDPNNRFNLKVYNGASFYVDESQASHTNNYEAFIIARLMHNFVTGEGAENYNFPTNGIISSKFLESDVLKGAIAEFAKGKSVVDFQVPFAGAELANDVKRTGSVFSSITGFTGSGTVTMVPTADGVQVKIFNITSLYSGDLGKDVLHMMFGRFGLDKDDVSSRSYVREPGKSTPYGNISQTYNLFIPWSSPLLNAVQPHPYPRPGEKETYENAASRMWQGLH